MRRVRGLFSRFRGFFTRHSVRAKAAAAVGADSGITEKLDEASRDATQAAELAVEAEAAEAAKAAQEADKREDDDESFIEQWFHHYDRVCEHPEEYRDHEREPLDQEALAEIGRKHMAHIQLPSIRIVGLSTMEKKLVFFTCEHTGAPNPFHALERITGDAVELKRAEGAWNAAYEEVAKASDGLRTAAAPLREAWHGPESERFGPALDAYLEGLDALAGSIKTTADCLKAIRSEAQLAENTVQMLINVLVGSLGGMLVAELVTAGTVTPVAAAQAQLEIAYVAKKIAMLGTKLEALFVDVIRILNAARGFQRLDEMSFVFSLAAAAPAVHP
jgi:hypothetical protein